MGYDIELYRLGDVARAVQKYRVVPKEVKEALDPYLDNESWEYWDKAACSKRVLINIIDSYLESERPVEDLDDVNSYYLLSSIEEVEQTYLSYNFGKFSHIWYLRDWLGGTSDDMAEALRAALIRMSKDGVMPCIPDEIWERTEFDGKIVREKMNGWTPDLRVFAYHLKRLKQICEDNPQCLVTADIDWDWQIELEDLPDPAKESDKPGPQFVAYYRHPIKGQMKIDTFAKASEIYTLAVLNKDPRAPQWLELAQSMPDAPKGHAE
jgi:hypothetical protein